MTSRILISGRFGNQLYIWAKAHELSLTNKRVILFHDRKVSANEVDSLLQLAKFCKHNIEIKRARWPFAAFRIVEIISTRYPQSIIQGLLGRIFYQADQKTSTWRIPSRTFLIKGYFQAYDTLKRVRKLVMPEFNSLINDNLNSRHSRVDEKFLKRKNLTVCHVRRGDYLRAPRHWGILGKGYYGPALIGYEDVICITDSSDDLSNSLPIDKIGLIWSKESLEELDSFCVMSKAQNLITANSTFSLWAGYLVSEYGGKVVAPFPWFSNNESWSIGIYHPNMELIPASYGDES